MRVWWVFALILCCHWVASADPVVHVVGSVSNPGDWTVERIKTTLADKVQAVDYSWRGVRHRSNCIPLWSLIEAAHPQFQLPDGKDCITWTVTVEGTDGYKAAFTLGDLSPKIGGTAVWVALDQDGGPLSDSDSPMRLVVPSDVKPTRWVHSIARFTIRPLP